MSAPSHSIPFHLTSSVEHSRGAEPPDTEVPTLGDPVALGLAMFLGGAGAAHFARPEFFDKVVPTPLGVPRFWTYASGVVELATAAMLISPRTRLLGARLALVTFVGVYPANIWAALQGGYEQMDPPSDSALFAWLRLPFQFPLFYWARAVAKRSVR